MTQHRQVAMSCQESPNGTRGSACATAATQPPHNCTSHHSPQPVSWWDGDVPRDESGFIGIRLGVFRYKLGTGRYCENQRCGLCWLLDTVGCSK